MTGDTILVVDDEKDQREWMVKVLERDGFKLFTAGDYDSAVAAFEANLPAIKLLVVDVTLPGRNGCELAKTLLGLKPELHVLFVSGHVGAEVVRFYGISVSDLFFLRKPFPPADLVERVHAVLTSTAMLPSVIMQSGAG